MARDVGENGPAGFQNIDRLDKFVRKGCTAEDTPLTLDKGVEIEGDGPPVEAHHDEGSPLLHHPGEEIFGDTGSPGGFEDDIVPPRGFTRGAGVNPLDHPPAVRRPVGDQGVGEPFQE